MASPSRSDRSLFPAVNASSLCGELLLCPPPPPPPPSSPVGSRSSSLVPALPIAAGSLFASATLAFLLALFILRRRRCRRRRRRREAAAAGSQPAAFINAGEVDHHVWYIRTPGLEESAIAGIATRAYRADEAVLGPSPADCAVCLSEFCDGEILRVLPKCAHAFHRSCIDTWLRSHVNCPLCRAPVVAPAAAPGGADPGAASTSYPSALSSPGFSRDHAEPDSAYPHALISSSQDDGRQPEASGGGPTEAEAAGERLELGSVNRVMIVRIPGSVEEELQPIRRSFSMGSFSPASRQRSPELDSGKETPTELDWINRSLRRQGNPATGTTSHKDAESS